MKKLLCHVLCLPLCIYSAYSQSDPNISFSNPLAEQVLLGNYNPADYKPADPIDEPDAIVQGLLAEISTDSIFANLRKLESFYTRHSASDTLSDSQGIGAARNWALQEFTRYSAAVDGRLLPSFLGFEADICGVGRHKNIMAVLPGTEAASDAVILIEAHIDSRCEDVCDKECFAPGVDDNGSGTALVLELARVMSRNTYCHTIVFMLTIGEEQGLWGSSAFAFWVAQQNIRLRAVFNNDIVGGIVCGETASPPGCPEPGALDSTNVRLYSGGADMSAHKNLARYTKLQYELWARGFEKTPMHIHIMPQEDREGRGGDHMPFSLRGYSAIRLTSAHEHGHGAGGEDYTDRQHSVRDVLGVDTDGDEIPDSLFVNLGYIRRNALINGVAASMAALAPAAPRFTAKAGPEGSLILAIEGSATGDNYTIAVRTDSTDFSAVWNTSITGDSIEIDALTERRPYFISISKIGEKGAQSLFSPEVRIDTRTNISTGYAVPMLQLLESVPLPARESSILRCFVADGSMSGRSAQFCVHTLSGVALDCLKFELQAGENRLAYRHSHLSAGMYFYTLYVEGLAVGSRKLVIAP